MKFFSVAEARAKFATLLKLSTDSEEQVIITKNGEPTAILLSIDEYESMTETIEVLSDPESYAAIMNHKNNPNQKTYTTEEVLASLAARVAREAAEREAAEREAKDTTSKSASE